MSRMSAVPVPSDLDRWDVRRDALDLGLAQFGHELVVERAVTDITGSVGLLETSESMLQSRRPRYRPGPGQGIGVAQVREEHTVAVAIDAVDRWWRSRR